MNVFIEIYLIGDLPKDSLTILYNFEILKIIIIIFKYGGLKRTVKQEKRIFFFFFYLNYLPLFRISTMMGQESFLYGNKKTTKAEY